MVAHPDDEVVGLGARLDRFARLTLIHATDGAPRDGADARRAGFADPATYAAARTAELAAALRVLEVRPARTLAYGFADQTLVEHLPELARRLEGDLAGQAVVLTHAYEGGHPDHDACAWAVACACATLRDQAPAAYEFAGYFGVDGRLHANVLHPDGGRPEAAWELTADERGRKVRTFAAHASQAETLANFPPSREAVRAAPAYDFTRPPPPGETHYDRYGWPLTGAGWRARAASARDG